jgi:perosamine synthetase
VNLFYDRFDPTPCSFPRPRIPVLAPMTADQLVADAAPKGRPVRHYARGRYALHAAYGLAGVGQKGALLAPAYHCRTMLDPALSLGAEVGLYALTAELHPDLTALQRAAAACRTKPAAVLVTHYFGLPRNIAPVAAWCQNEGVALIEDCSHALAPVDGALVGHTGRWAVSSPYKFFPCADGGWLWCNDATPLPAQPGSPGVKAELRGLLHAVQQLREPARAPDIGSVADELSVLSGAHLPHGRDWTEHTAAPSCEYLAHDEGVGSLAVSRWIQRHTNLGVVARQRRARYQQWAAAVSGLTGARALLPDLPPGVVPYMFPLLVDDPARAFYPLKRLGVPLWRWDDMAVSDCAVSRRYRQGVFHLPVHQAMSDGQMAWMLTAVCRATAPSA